MKDISEQNRFDPWFGFDALQKRFQPALCVDPVMGAWPYAEFLPVIAQGF
jgi:hypothetical protein